MYQGKHFYDKRKPNIRLNKAAVLIIAVLLLLGAANQQEQAEHSGKQFHIIVS